MSMDILLLLPRGGRRSRRADRAHHRHGLGPGPERFEVLETRSLLSAGYASTGHLHATGRRASAPEVLPIGAEGGGTRQRAASSRPMARTDIVYTYDRGQALTLDL